MPIPPPHQAFIDRAVADLSSRDEIIGMALGGSAITDEMDEFSDIDMVVVVRDEALTLDRGYRLGVAGGLGELLQGFTGEHVGEPRLVICLYGPPLLHVDLKFVTLPQFEKRVEDPIVLYDPSGDLARMIAEHPGFYPSPDFQWIEDRFWVWIHYCGAKLGRGEVMEAATAVGFLMERVVIPLAMHRQGHRANGVRRLEKSAVPQLERLQRLCVPYDREQIKQALIEIVHLYREVRPTTIARSLAEEPAFDYLVAC